MHGERRIDPVARIPRQSRAIVTMSAILTAAARIFKSRGFEGNSTSRIAATAGVGIGSVYEYFPSKQSLISAVAKRHLEQIADQFEEAIKATAHLPLEQALEVLVDVLMEGKLIEPGVERAFLNDAKLIDLWSLLEEFDRRMLPMLIESLRAREIRPKDLETAAFVLLHSLRAVSVAVAILKPDRLGDPGLRSELRALTLSYLRPWGASSE